MLSSRQKDRIKVEQVLSSRAVSQHEALQTLARFVQSEQKKSEESPQLESFRYLSELQNVGWNLTTSPAEDQWVEGLWKTSASKSAFPPLSAPPVLSQTASVSSSRLATPATASSARNSASANVKKEAASVVDGDPTPVASSIAAAAATESGLSRKEKRKADKELKKAAKRAKKEEKKEKKAAKKLEKKTKKEVKQEPV
jgi:hypothetical protein